MTLYRHALRQQALPLALWALVLALMVVAVASAAGSVTQNDFGSLLQTLPASLRATFGGDLILQRPLDGYIHVKLLEYLPLIIGLFATFQATALFAREVEQRQLEVLLSLPVSRQRLLLARLAALLTSVTLLWAATLAVLYLAMRLNGLVGDWNGYLLASWNGLLVNAALAALATWISAAARGYRRGLRAAIMLVVFAYLLDFSLRLAQADPLWRLFLLFGFYDPAGLILQHRFPWFESAVLLAAAAAGAWGAARAFAIREV